MSISRTGYVPEGHSSAADVFTQDYAKRLDQNDPLRHLRDEFVIPSKSDLKRKSLPSSDDQKDDHLSIYFCGNSLGVQPKAIANYVQAQLDTWATKGVFGHFRELHGSLLTPWLEMDEAAATAMAHIVGAKASEVAVMQTLTANLHLLLASFYQPTKERYKIILEGKAFPSDHFAIQSHVEHRGHSYKDAMVIIDSSDPNDSCLSLDHILRTIDDHADSTALVLLSGIQFYTGQLFDIQAITTHAKAKGIVVGWDLAHAAGNVPLSLHDWDVDFAVWCTYKYMNCGPGATGGAFVHEKHGTVDYSKGLAGYRPRLAGWWGGDKTVRFEMENTFKPIPGAGGFQLSNPSALDLASVLGSLSVFAKTDMKALRAKSMKATAYLEYLLTQDEPGKPSQRRPYSIITPREHDRRGAQLSLRLTEGILDDVMEKLEEGGVVVDERKPDVVRVAPAPLYNSFEDVWRFVQVFMAACDYALDRKEQAKE